MFSPGKVRSALSHLIAGAVGGLYFVSFQVCLNRFIGGTERSGAGSSFVLVLIAELTLGAIVFSLKRLTPVLDGPSAAKVIIFVAMALSTLYGLYWGALTIGALTGIAGSLFAAPCVVPILIGGRDGGD